MTRTCATALAAAALSSPAAASPWGRDAGDLFISTRTDYFQASEPSEDPDAVGPMTLWRNEATLYAEYGAFRRLTVGAKVVYGATRYFDGFEDFAASGVSEIEAFVQYAPLRRGRDVVSVMLLAAAPSKLETGARPGFADDGVDLEARALYGRSLFEAPFKAFVGAEAGFRRRFGDGADQARGELLFGAHPTGRTTVLLQAFAVRSIGPATAGGSDYDIVKLQPSLVWRVSRRWSLQGGYLYEAAGRNVLRGDSFFLGAWSAF